MHMLLLLPETQKYPQKSVIKQRPYIPLYKIVHNVPCHWLFLSPFFTQICLSCPVFLRSLIIFSLSSSGRPPCSGQLYWIHLDRILRLRTAIASLLSVCTLLKRFVYGGEILIRSAPTAVALAGDVVCFVYCAHFSFFLYNGRRLEGGIQSFLVDITRVIEEETCDCGL